jgi:hypothetical protein
MASLVQNNNEHSLTSPEQKCSGEFGALAGDKSPSLPGTTNRGLWKVYTDASARNLHAMHRSAAKSNVTLGSKTIDLMMSR